MDEKPESHQISGRWFALAVVVMILGVTGGYYLLVRPQEHPRPANQPTAMGHFESEIYHQPTNAPEAANETNH